MWLSFQSFISLGRYGHNLFWVFELCSLILSILTHCSVHWMFSSDPTVTLPSVLHPHTHPCHQIPEFIHLSSYFYEPFVIEANNKTYFKSTHYCSYISESLPYLSMSSLFFTQRQMQVWALKSLLVWESSFIFIDTDEFSTKMHPSNSPYIAHFNSMLITCVGLCLPYFLHAELSHKNFFFVCWFVCLFVLIWLPLRGTAQILVALSTLN